MRREHTESSAPITRRQVLRTASAGVALGVLGAESAGPALASAASVGTSSAPPDVDLMEEHGVLKRILLIYEEASRRISGGEPTPTTEIHASALIIHDFIEGFHEALEEGFIFPQLTKAKLLVSTVNTLYVQHARGRGITQYLLAQTGTSTGTADPNRLAAAMNAFVRMYQPHEAREDTVVFPTYRSVHNPDQLNELGATFAHLQRQQFGHRGLNSFVQQVAQIEMSLGLYDLDQFTAEQMTNTS
jgi:hemerythrin-like domain-containing protein